MKAAFLHMALLCLVAAVAVGSDLRIKRAERPDKYRRGGYYPPAERSMVKPLLDTPMRHTFVARDPDHSATRGTGGSYWLTGTVSGDGEGADFQNNDGVFLWRSRGLEQWTLVGQVWSIASQGSAWQKERRLNPDDPSGPPVRGMIAPEIHFIDGEVYIPYSMNDQGVGVLKSKTGKPEGPYADLGRLTAEGGDASLFVDFDGAVHLLWGSGRIAKLAPDLTSLAGEPHDLNADLDLYPVKSYGAVSDAPTIPVARRGFQLRKNQDGKGNRTYILTYDGATNRIGKYCRDTGVAISDSLYGPYVDTHHDQHQRNVLLSHGAQSVLFQDDAGHWYATFYGDDDAAAFRDRPGIVPLRFNVGLNRPEPQHYKSFTQYGPWATKEPLIRDVQLNDQQILNAPDGYYYLTGSSWDPFRHGAVSVWKSRTLEPSSQGSGNWKEFRAAPFTEMPAFQRALEKEADLLDLTVKWPKQPKVGGTPWGAEIFHFKDSFWIAYQFLTSNETLRGELKKEDAGCNPLFRSVSGRGTGPYQLHWMMGGSALTMFEDDDGSLYTYSGKNQLSKLNEGLDGYDRRWMQRLKQQEGFGGLMNSVSVENREGLLLDYDIGGCILKMFGKYVLFTCNCIGGYDYQYWVADRIEGPYGRPRVCMPHGGHGFVMKDKDGDYHALEWTHTGHMRPFLHRLHVEQRGADIVIMPKWEYEHQQKGVKQ